MNARVHDQTDGAEAFAGELPESIVGIGVKTELSTKRFDVQGPTFGVCTISVKSTKFWQSRHGASDGSLKDVAWHGFVQDERLFVVANLLFRLIGVEVEPTGGAAVG